MNDIERYYSVLQETREQCKKESIVDIVEAAENCLRSMMFDAKVDNFFLLGQKMDFMSISLSAIKDFLIKSVDSN